MSLRLKITFFLLIFCFCFFKDIFCSSGGFYADNDHNQSILLSPLTRKDQKKLQHEILQLLGLDHRPKRRRHEVHSSAPKYLIDMYSDIEKNEKEDENHHDQQTVADSDFIVSFVNKIHQKYPHIRHEKDKQFWFDTTEVPADEEIFNAEFRLYRNFTHKLSTKEAKYILSLYAVSDIDSSLETTLKLVNEMTISNQTGWLSLNVTGTVMDWVAYPKKNIGLYLKISSPNSASHSLDSIGIISSSGPDDYQPFMVAYFKTRDQYRVRTKRAARKQPEMYYDQDRYAPKDYMTMKSYDYERKSCQRSTLYVSFKDLGWEDWIIAPDGYGAFFCEGKCSFPLNSQMNATNHAIVQTLVHLMDPSVVPKPQCSPTQLSSITVLYFDDHSNVILKKYRHMVVKSCGCH